MTNQKRDNNSKKDNYHSSDIIVLKGLDPIRKRPGMYIGNVEDGTGLLHMIFEVLDNSVDEAISGHCDLIELTLHSDHSVTIKDHGRGIPTTWHESSGLPTPEVVLTTIHSGGKFNTKSYAVSGGLHGVGLCAVNALSEKLKIVISRGGHVYEQEYVRGVPQAHKYTDEDKNWRGTEVSFLADKQIFGKVVFNSEDIQNKLREIAYLNPNLKLFFRDEITSSEHTFCYSDGLNAYVDYVLQNNRKELFADKIYIENIQGNEKVKVSLAYTKSIEPQLIGYTNNIKQVDGGSHITGFKSGVSKAVAKYMTEDSQYNKQVANMDIVPDDARSGLVALISVHSSKPSFSSQTKEKLVSSNIRQYVDHSVSTKLYEFLLEHKDIAEKITERVMLACKAREAALKQRDSHKQLVDKGLVVSSLVGKLCTCQSKDPTLSELFIVEGESAGGTARVARDRTHQAVLPLKGKIMNVLKAETGQAFKSIEIVNILKSLDCGFSENCDPSKCRYHKVIIMADGDPDGKHICTLALTVIYKYLRPLIEAGFIYICYPPLFSFKEHGKYVYFHNSSDLNSKLIAIMRETVKIKLSDETVLTEAKTLSALKAYVSYTEFKENCKINLPEEALDTFVHVSFSSFNTDIYTLIQSTADFLNKDYKHKFNIDSDKQSLLWVEEGQLMKFNLAELYVSSVFKKITNLYKPLALTLHPNNEWCNVVMGRFNVTEPLLYSALEQAFNTIKKQKQLKRYKGLGEMNYDQLWNSSMDPAQRTLVRVKIEDAEKAAEAMEVLMGSDVGPRKEFITEHASDIEFDIT